LYNGVPLNVVLSHTLEIVSANLTTECRSYTHQFSSMLFALLVNRGFQLLIHMLNCCWSLANRRI